MRHYAPRQRKDGRWDYTIAGTNEPAYPTGYCCEFRPFALGEFGATQDFIDKHEAAKDKFHTDGHETQEQACDCYKEYLLDQRSRLGLVDDSAQEKCLICGAWTQLYATVQGSKFYRLCEQHNNREGLAEVLPRPGESWRS